MGAGMEWANTTTLHPVALAMVAVLSVLVILSSRRQMVVPFLVLALFVSPAQRIVIGGLDFTLLRILIVAGWIKLALDSRRLPALKLHAVDKWVLAGVLIQVVMYSARTRGVGAYILGKSFDALGSYFIFRFAIKDMDDIRMVIKAFIVLSVPVAVFFLIERVTARNVFSVFGGVPLETMIREGRLRCTGAFAHPILAGCFFSSVVPLVLAGYWQRELRHALVALGLVSCLAVIAATSSTTPLITLMAGVVGIFLFNYRRYIPGLAKVFVILLLLNTLRTGQPIWHLVSRFDIVGGSTGYHRYRLIDAWIRNFSGWWLFGLGSTESWGPGLLDITNQYIVVALEGGALSLAGFLMGIGSAFSRLRRCLQDEGFGEGDRRLVWGLGVSLFTHLVSFISVSYFGQVFVLWYLTLAMCGSLPLRESEAPKTAMLAAAA